MGHKGISLKEHLANNRKAKEAIQERIAKANKGEKTKEEKKD